MNDLFNRLKDQARAKAETREKEKTELRYDNLRKDEERVNGEVAEYLGISVDEVSSCCGNICPHCETFLDKAIALIELGYDSHLFMNPTQEEMFLEALEIYRNDRTGFNNRKAELMDAMR